jgi:hypothetical protein
MRALALILTAVLAGCASPAPVPAGDSPTCTAGPDCTAKWDAAGKWVARNISFPIKMSGDYLLQTDGPHVVGITGPSRLAATIKREPDGAGRFRITATIGCGNPFGCIPEAPAALLDFNRTVSAAVP